MPPGQLSVAKNVLKDVVALVDVKSSLGNPALAISSRLQSLGATVIRTLNASVTHVIFRNGSENILNTAKKAKKHVVSPAWVKACQMYNFHVSEASYEVAEKQDFSFLQSVGKSSENKNLETKKNVIEPIATTLTDLSVPPVIWRSRKRQTLEPLSVPKEVTTFFQRKKKQKSVKSSQGDLFSSGEISSDSENGASDMASVVTKSRRSPHSFSEIPPERSSSDKAHVFTTGVIASTQNEAAPTNSMELTGNISPIHRTKVLAENHTKQPESMVCHAHRRLLPLDRGEQELVEKLITPVGKSHSDTPTFPKPGRSTHLLFSNIGRLSSKAPLTADLLLEVVQSAHTPKSCNKFEKSVNKTPTSGRRTPTRFQQRHRATSSALARKNRSPRTNPHRMKKHSGRSVQSAVSRTAKKRVSFSSDVKFCSMKPLVKSKKARNQLSTTCAGKQTDEPHSTGNTVLDTLIRTCAVQVDLDASGCPSTHSTPVSLRLPSPRDPNEKEHMTAEHRSSTHGPKRKNRLKSPISVDSTSCPQSSSNKSSGSKQIIAVSSQSVPVSTRRRSARLNPQPVVNQPNASGGIHPLTTRNSLDDFNLLVRQTERRNNRMTQLESPLRSDGDLIIGFTGLPRDEEQTLRSLVFTSKLTGYRFIQLRRPLDPMEAKSRSRSVGCSAWTEAPTHLITLNPYRRTLNLLLGLIHDVTIVTAEWVKQSALCGIWMSAMEYTPEGIPRRCKHRKLSSLFSGYNSIYVGSIQRPSPKDLIQLLELAGAKITFQKSSASVLIGCSKSGALCLKPDWVLDSIVQGHIQPTTEYVLRPNN